MVVCLVEAVTSLDKYTPKEGAHLDPGQEEDEEWKKGLQPSV